jgi:hypothetical protein
MSGSNSGSVTPDSGPRSRPPAIPTPASAYSVWNASDWLPGLSPSPPRTSWQQLATNSESAFSFQNGGILRCSEMIRAGDPIHQL